MKIKLVLIGVFALSSLGAPNNRGLVEIILGLLHLSGGNPAGNSACSVSSASRLSDGEVRYMAKRAAYIQEALQARYGHTSITKTPKVAVCISGGGLRAMVGGLGFLKALQQEGLLDITSYLCGLSGSTWAMSGWLESGMTVAEYLEFLKKCLKIGLLNQVDARAIVQELLKKIENDHAVTLDDIWGSLIAQKILVNAGRKKLTQITLTNYVAMPVDGSIPLPIYNCVTPLEASDNQQYRWVEWTPFAVRCPYLKTAVPLWGLGRVFKQGKSINNPAEFSLSFGHGVWGSAISGDMQDLLGLIDTASSGYEQEIINKILNALQDNFVLDEASEMRPLPAHLPNWNCGLAGAVCSDTAALTFVDCGFLCNLPLPPVLDPLRSVDVIIVVDLTMQQDLSSELTCMQRYALNNRLPFPLINKTLLRNTCSVHGSKSSAPTIIYFPLIANPAYQNGWDPLKASFTDTLNLQYTPQQVDLLSGLMYTACKQNLAIIWGVIDKICLAAR